MSNEERCTAIIQLAEAAKKENDYRIIKQIMQEIHTLSFLPRR